MSIKDFTDVIMNPVRQRIIQYFILHEKGTPAQIHEDLSDVPKASLYRHIKILFEAGCIEVVEEKQVRGTIEKTYALVSNPIGEEPTVEDVSSLIYSSLMSIQTSFVKYFSREDVDAAKAQQDMIMLQASTLMMSDEEFMEFLQKMGEVIAPYVRNQPGEGRKPRRLTIISSPPEE